MAVAKRPLRYLFFAIALIFALVGGATAGAQTSAAVATQSAPFESRDALVRVRAFLNENEVIRVGLEGSARSGRGNGHQSTAATVVQRLRELGYEGLIQVVYDADQAARLEILFPPFRASRGPAQTFFESGLEFLESQYFHSRSPPEVDLGLIGAADILQTRHRLNVRRLIVFQPLNWWGRTAYIDDDLGADNWYGNYSLPELNRLGFVFRVPTITDPVDFIETDMAHVPALAAKVPGLLAMASPRGHEVAGVYGHSISSGGQLLDYIGGVSWAIRAAPSEFQRGVVVPVFNAINPLMWASIRVSARVDSRLRGRVRFFDVKDVNLPRRIRSMGSDEILVVRVGPVAKSVFDYFLTTSTVAPVVEGRNSANLMMLAGTPYLPSNTRERWHFADSLEEATSELGEIGHRAAIGMAPGENLALIDGDTHRAIGQFLLDARRPGSLVSRRFESSRRGLDPARDDKIVRGLLIALERRNAGRPPWIQMEAIPRMHPVPQNTIRCHAMFAR